MEHLTIIIIISSSIIVGSIAYAVADIIATKRFIRMMNEQNKVFEETRKNSTIHKL